MLKGSLPRRHFWVLYPLWIAGCALLFLLLRAVDVEDPSRRSDRIGSDRAGEIALDLVQRRDPGRYRDYEVVNVAWAREGEVAADPRWVVLLDGRVRSGLETAVVVELEPKAGALIRIREVPRE